MSHQEALSAYRRKEYEKALAIWEDEAKKDNDQAMANLGIMYLKGEGVKKDALCAKDWFEKASDFDNDSANYNLALMYQSKIGVEENVDRAIEYFRKAVKKNHQGANFRLALLLLKDRNNLSKLQEGFTCMLNAAKSGHPMAKTQITGLDNKPNSNTHNETFRNKSTQEQIEILQDALDRYIRPVLIQDGGNLALIEYIATPNIQIHLAYQGNCAGCSMASTSTYTLILDTLSKVIDENIGVYVL